MKQNIITIVLLILISLYFNYHRTFDSVPKGYHYWRQTDGASQVVNYMKNGLNFFNFGTLSYSSNDHNSNESLSEFPILYYFAAILNLIFGYSGFFARFLHYIILFLGLFYLQKSAFLIIKNYVFSLLIVISIFTTIPVAFYGNTVMPDIASLGLLFIGFFHFATYYNNNSTKNLIYVFIFLTFSSLLKITMLYGQVSILLFILITNTKYSFSNKKLNFTKIHLLFGIISIIIPLLWSLYVIWYNKNNNTGIFLAKALPIWTVENPSWMFNQMFNNNLYKIINFISAVLFLFSVVLVILFYKRFNKVLQFFILFFSISSLFYFLLFFPQFYYHNYYFIEFSPLYVVITISILYLIKNFLSGYTRNSALVILILINLGSLYFTHFEIRKLYKSNNSEFTNEYLFEDLYTINPYLNKIGIKPDDLIIFDFDYTPNYSLFITQHYGWTEKNIQWYGIDGLKKRGAKYLISSRHKPNQNSEKFKTNLIGIWGGLEIYSLDQKNTNVNLNYENALNDVYIDQFKTDTIVTYSKYNSLYTVFNLNSNKMYLFLVEQVSNGKLMFVLANKSNKYYRTTDKTILINNKKYYFMAINGSETNDTLHFYTVNENENIALSNIKFLEAKK